MAALKFAPIITATANKPCPNGLGVGFLGGEGVSILAPHLRVWPRPFVGGEGLSSEVAGAWPSRRLNASLPARRRNKDSWSATVPKRKCCTAIESDSKVLHKFEF